jgi:hypothetical protein
MSQFGVCMSQFGVCMSQFGVCMSQFGVFMSQFGVCMSQFGVCMSQFGVCMSQFGVCMSQLVYYLVTEISINFFEFLCFFRWMMDFFVFCPPPASSTLLNVPFLLCKKIIILDIRTIKIIILDIRTIKPNLIHYLSSIYFVLPIIRRYHCIRGYIQNIPGWCRHLYSSCGSVKHR